MQYMKEYAEHHKKMTKIISDTCVVLMLVKMFIVRLIFK